MSEEISKEEMSSWKTLSESVYGDIYEADFQRDGLTVKDVIDKLNEEDKFGNRALLKIVIGGKFYDVKSVYTIEDDTTTPVICIDGDE